MISYDNSDFINDVEDVKNDYARELIKPVPDIHFSWAATEDEADIVFRSEDFCTNFMKHGALKSVISGECKQVLGDSYWFNNKKWVNFNTANDLNNIPRFWVANRLRFLASSGST